MKKCADCKKQISSPSTRCKKCANLGKNNPMYGVGGKKHPFYGKKHSVETKQKLRKLKLGKIGMVGKANPMYGKKGKDWVMYGKTPPGWKGGITPLNKMIKNCFNYRQWRSDVFTRDDFTCSDCGIHGGQLQAHHIKEFYIIMKENKICTLEQAIRCSELWNLNNGITLCKNCHLKKKHSWRKQ